jgi:aminopeptidase C
MAFAPTVFLLLLTLISAPAHADPKITSLDVTPVTDQGDTLQCWAVSATARMDVDASRNAGHLVKLSSRYLVYTKTGAEVIRYILGGKFESYKGQLCENCADENIYYEQGGIFPDAVEAVKLYGVMPESAYGGFPKDDEALFRDLNALIAEYAAHASQVHFKDPALQNEVIHRVTSVMNRHWGKPPEEFDFEGRHYNAQSFFAATLPQWKSSRALELNYPAARRRHRGKTESFDGTKYGAYRTNEQSELLRILAETLQAGYAPLVQYKVIDEDHTQADGSIGFASHGLKKPHSIDWNSREILDHYVLAIGAQWSASGQLERLLVKNTWGTFARDHYGIHWIEADYLFLIEGVEVLDHLERRFKNEGIL